MSLGKALHSNGVSAQGLEEALNKISETLKLEAEIFATPTVIIASFKSESERQNSVTRVLPGIVDLQKLMKIDELGDKVIAGKVNLDEALQELQTIVSTQKLYSSVIEVLAYALLGGAASIFFKGGFHELIFAMLGGVLVGIINELTAYNGLNKSFEFIAGFVVALFTALLYSYVPDFSIQIVTIASLIVLIPGLTLTISMTELATNNLAAGTARLMQAILVFFKMGFGIALGTSIVQHWRNNLIFLEKPLNTFVIDFTWPALIIAALAFTILFRARLKQYPWILSSGAIAFFVTNFVANIMGPHLSAFVGGLCVGIFANIYAQIFKKPAALISMPGLILLVPGSIGFRGIASLVNKDTLIGISTTFEMFMIAIALVSGLLLANFFVVPKRSL